METPNPTPAPLPPDEELVEVRKPTSLLVAQFFLFPLIIIGICVVIFLFFGYITYDQRTPSQYLNEIRSGSDTQRWHAAFELSNIVASNKDEIRSPEFMQDLVSIYTQSPDTDTQVRLYVALMLGQVGDASVVPALVEGLRREEMLKTKEWDQGAFRPSISEIREELISNQIYTLWALGSIGDNAAVPGVLEQAKSDDPSIRKMVAYVLGVLNDPRGIDELRIMLNDPRDDVHYNAALALARLNNAEGADMLLKLLDPSHVESLPDMTPDQKTELRVNAVRGLGMLKFEPARETIAAISQDDPVLAVRDAALEALKKF